MKDSISFIITSILSYFDDVLLTFTNTYTFYLKVPSAQLFYIFHLNNTSVLLYPNYFLRVLL